MQLRKIILPFFLIILGFGIVFAQNSSSNQTIYAPYPTNIRVGIQGTTVVITWTDSPDHTGAYNVYKYTKMPDASNFKNAELLGKVDKGIQQFFYTITDTNSYYFFILPINTQNQVVEIFIPLQNYTIIPIRNESVYETPKPVQKSTSATISDFTAIAGIKSVDIKFSINNYSGKLFLYRSQKSFVNEISLIEAVQIHVFEVNQAGSGILSVSDMPFPGIQYYWAVVTEQELAMQKVTFSDRKNTMLEGASIALMTASASADSMPRYAPLPIMQAANIFLPSQKIAIFDFSATAQKNISIVLQQSRYIAENKVPSVQYVHKKFPASLYTEASILGQTAEKYFTTNQYIELVREMDNFLAIPRSNEGRAAALLYRAQANTLLGNFQSALLDAVIAYQVFPAESDVWIDYLIRAIMKSGK